MRSAVFLDRDGVLSLSDMRAGKAYAPRRLEDFRLFSDAAESVAELKRAGFLVVVVTNQPDIGNGLVAAETVEAMHRQLRVFAPVDDIRMCPHGQSDGCDCRKPKPGMLLAAAAAHNIDLEKSFMVGDRASDIYAGLAAGCRTVFVDRGYAEDGPDTADARVQTLNEAVSFILSTSLPERFHAQP